MSEGAPGYRSWAWTTQDWRVIVPLANGRLDYSERCGGPANRTPSGHVRLCLPFAVASELAATSEGAAILHRQAVSKQRAAVGVRVPWHPRIVALWRELDAQTPKDRMFSNPKTPGTRLKWETLADWLAAWDELEHRPPAYTKYEALRKHLDTLTPELFTSAESVYELDRMGAILRDRLPPKGNRGHSPLVPLVDAVDRIRTRFVHAGGSRSFRVTASQPGFANAAEDWVSPIQPLVDNAYSFAAWKGTSAMPLLHKVSWRLHYALARHPEMVIPLVLEAALATLPLVADGAIWDIVPDDDRHGSIYLRWKRWRGFNYAIPHLTYAWWASPTPWGFAVSTNVEGISRPGYSTARDAAEALFAEIKKYKPVAFAELTSSDLTAASLNLRRIGQGHYVYSDASTGEEWSIFHHHGEFQGEDNWVYMRTDDGAAGLPFENQAQDSYPTKGAAVEALIDRLKNRPVRVPAP